jgi:hypothetical protein
VKRLLAFAAVLATAAPAAADDGAALLGKAQKAIDDIDYETARTLTDQALDSGALDRGQLARAHMLAGEVAAALGDDAGAHDHFERWILLAPDARLPDGLSPKITQPFTAAHASADALGPARFDVDASRARGKLAITVTGDPLHMVARVHVVLDHGGEREGVGGEFEVPIPDEAGRATLTLLDEHGNTLAEHDAELATTTATVAPAPASENVVEHSVPALLRWPTWAVITVGAAGACGYFAYAAKQDQDQLTALNNDSAMHTFDEAKALEDRGRSHTLDANIAGGVAIAALAATVISIVVDHKVEVQPLAAPGAAGASAAIHF